MRVAAAIFTVSALCVSSLAQQHAAPPSTSASSTTQPPEMLVYQRGFDSKRAPDDFFTGVGRVISGPVVGPLIIGAGIALGVPPDLMVGLGSSAAAAASELSRSNMQNPSRGVYTYTMAAPDGYSVCAVKIDAISIMPGREDRPRLSASGSKSAVTISVSHQQGAFGAGRSKVKLASTMVVVRDDVYSKYPSCKLTDQSRTFISICRGRECIRGGHVNRWYPGPA